jgi:hypothetical protein
MKNRERKIRTALALIGLMLTTGGFQLATSQDLRWIRVGQLQSFFVDYGSENELTPFNNNSFSWPAQYGDNQYTSRMKGLWIGATNFYDPVEKKTKAVKVVGSGPRYDAVVQPTMIFPQSIKLIGRSNPPLVTVDNQLASGNQLYDVLDEVQSDLPCDRMVVIKFNTSMGVSVTKKVLAFIQQNHDNYFIYDYVFTNTGIFNKAGDVMNPRQTLNNFWVHFSYRYAFAGVTSSGWGSTWGAFESEWGTSTVQRDFGPYRPLPTSGTMRGFYSFYSPAKQRTSVTYDQDWGCPNQNGGGLGLNGLLGSAKYSGCVTLFASQSTQNYSTDDPNQPATTSYFGSDEAIETASVSQYDDVFMQARYQRMTEGRLPQSMGESVGNQYVDDWGKTHTDRYGGEQGQGFGPYTLAPGDSIHIVFAEGVNGISWEKCREVGAVWYEYYKGTSAPPLVFPTGTSGTTYTDYTRAWVQSGKDSLLQTFRNATANYRADYKIPQPPPAPSSFTVTSGGDHIELKWDNNAARAEHFDGYVIYRCEGIVKDYRSVYKKVFECNASNAVTKWDDTSAVRGFNYYYYIQSKDDGTQNDAKPGTPLYSSLFLTLTSVPAHLLRPSGNLLGEVRVVPNPYDIRSRKWQFGDPNTGTTGNIDRLLFYGLPPKCKLKIFTENGTLIWEKDHTNGSGDEAWDSKTSSNQIVASGIYILFVEVIEDTYATQDRIANYGIYDQNLKLMYPQGAVVFRKGDKIFSAGQSTFRKFVIIR